MQVPAQYSFIFRRLQTLLVTMIFSLLISAAIKYGTSAVIAYIVGIIGLPGIGHTYFGRVGRGIGILLLGLFLYVLTIIFVFIFPPIALIFSIGYQFSNYCRQNNYRSTTNVNNLKLVLNSRNLGFTME